MTTTLTSAYDLEYSIGSGTYGTVYKARLKADYSQTAAIKKFKPTKPGEGISLTACREIGLLRELKHDNIVNLREIFATQEHNEAKTLFLVFDYAEYDLDVIIKFHKNDLKMPIEEKNRKSIMWQILTGIHYLHSHYVIHRDLKPANILVMGRGQETGTIKVGDFGLARLFDHPLRPLAENGLVVTLWYRAPELLLGSRHYTTAIDIWAVGCIFAELMISQPLFPGKERQASSVQIFQEEQLKEICKVLGIPSENSWPAVKYLENWKAVASWKAEIQTHTLEQVVRQERPANYAVAREEFELLKQMLVDNPVTRLPANNCLEDAWFGADPLPQKNSLGSLLDRYPTRLKQVN